MRCLRPVSYTHLKEIGKLVYDLHRGAEVTNEEMDEKMAQVDAKQEKLAALRDKLAEMRSVTACPHCGLSLIHIYHLRCAAE